MGRSDPYLGVHAVTVFVRDQEQSLRFYLDQLGFKLTFDGRLQSGKRTVAVAPPDGSTVLTLIAPEPDSEEYQLIGRRTPVVFMTDDVSAKFLEWRKRGVRFRYTPRLRRVKYDRPVTGGYASVLSRNAGPPIWGSVHTRFEDIDGNTFSLVSFDDMSRALEEQRRAAAAKLEAERRAAQELEIARQVQARLFPQALPPLRTLEYSGACMQARQVGGDYYDFLDLGKERLGLIVGDIAGKGIAAALLMANLQANLRAQCATALEQPERLLRSVNQLFYENTAESDYATLFFAEYDDRARHLRYANCGHLSGLLLRTDCTVERLESTCTVVGLFKDWDCAINETGLCPGDTLALYTDGITESFSDSGEEFGERRLIEALDCRRTLPADTIVRTVLDEVKEFSPREQHDDLTLIIARCRRE
jgi:serine phosphatase RsbU (regulator of sigma subunit)/catechol 2,3-dioxygenase-like lactoylglutathione lyase family enzyme